MMIYFINNGVAVLVSNYQNSELVKMISYIELDFINFNIGNFVMLVAISVELIIIGMRLFKSNRDK